MPEGKSALNVWIFHPYGGPPGVGRFERQINLARATQSGSVKNTVFFASWHHINGQAVEETSRDERGVNYIPIPCRQYTGNGVGRILNMLDFDLGVRSYFREECAEGKTGAPDVIVASSPHPFVYTAAAFVRKKTNARVVLEVRDLWPESLTAFAGVGSLHPVVVLFRWMMKMAYRGADAVVSVLPGSKKYLQENGCQKVVLEVPNGISVSEVDRRLALSLDVAHKDAISPLKASGKILIGYCGAMGPPNSLGQLVDLQHYVASNGLKVNYHFLLIGEGNYKEELQNCRRQFDDPIFTILPSLPKPEVPSWLNQMDAGVVFWEDRPLYRHGVSPNKVWEYFAVSIPVLWVGNTRYDPVKESGGGFSLLPNDPEALHRQLETMIEEKSNFPALGGRGRKYAEKKADWAILGQQYLSLYADLQGQGE